MPGPLLPARRDRQIYCRRRAGRDSHGRGRDEREPAGAPAQAVALGGFQPITFRAAPDARRRVHGTGKSVDDEVGGGWVSSTVDLLRFMAGVDGRATRPDILSAGLVAEMTGSGPTACASGACYHAAGWLVRPTQGEATWSHGGSLPGTTSTLVRSYHDFSWVALFNARSGTGNFGGELDAALWGALASVTSFPTHDLFATFP